jgi:hypothetical protein
MARVQNPIIGQAVNTAGGMIFSNWKTLKVMRSKPLAVANPKTPAQQANRRRMALLASRMRELLQTIRLGYVRYQNGTTQWAQFIKANYATGTSDNGTIASLVTSALRFAQGSLLPVMGLVNAGIIGQDITVDWTDNSGQPGANATDKLHVVLVNADGSAVAAINTGVTRATEIATITAPDDITAATAVVYAFFANVAGDDVSDSQIAA